MRFEQGRYEDASLNLNAAIAISKKPEVLQYIPNPAAAHCLIAQVLEKQPKLSQTALSEWGKCADLASVTNPDEDEWLHLARQKVSQKKK